MARVTLAEAFVRLAAPSDELKADLLEAETLIKGAAARMQGAEVSQAAAVAASTKALGAKSGALAGMAQTMTGAVGIMALFSGRNSEVVAGVGLLAVVLTNVRNLVRGLNRDLLLLATNPMTLLLAVLGAGAIALTVQTRKYEELARALDAIPDRTKAVRDAQTALLAAQGKDTEVALRRIEDERRGREQSAREALDQAREAARLMKDRQEAAAFVANAEAVYANEVRLANKVAAEQIAAYHKKAAEQRVEAVQKATVAILEAEGKAHAAKLAQIEEERQKVLKETGDEALAYQLAAAKKLQADRDFAEQRLRLFQTATEAILEATEQQTRLELFHVQTKLTERKRELDAALRAELVSYEEHHRLVIEAEQAAAEKQKEILRKLFEDRRAFFISEAAETFRAAGRNLEAELLELDQRTTERRAEIQKKYANLIGVLSKDQVQERRQLEQELQASLVQLEQRTALQRVQIYATMVAQMKDNIDSLKAAARQSAQEIADLDHQIAQAQGRARGATPAELQAIDVQQLQAQVRNPELGAAARLRAQRELIQVFQQQAQAARDARAAAQAAFAETPTAENAQAVVTARNAAIDAQAKLNAAYQQEATLLEQLKAGEKKREEDLRKQMDDAIAKMKQFQQTYAAIFAEIAVGAKGAGDRLLQILGRQIPDAILQRWAELKKQLEDLGFTAPFTVPTLPAPPAPAQARGNAPGPSSPATAGGGNVTVSINGQTFNFGQMTAAQRFQFFKDNLAWMLTDPEARRQVEAALARGTA